ncbi:hypothetical protein LTR37_014409 [Vermiconidia calcicola]|uniref:Uncharacterized protein n=1 Tax=Vermiconidia calcicola TaxID=1690605 RepID=A0ACC3MUZ2_9PEZI|nr:hypothetical protein LTR37_014409 [Vermiconidia calcicola]
MLEDGEYSPWIKSVFGSIKSAVILLGIRQYSTWLNNLIEYYFKHNKGAREAEYKHFRYAADRVDGRWQRQRMLSRPDSWAQVFDSFTIDEQHVTAQVLMNAGTETTATALSGLTFYLLQDPVAMEKLKKEVRSEISSLRDVTFEALARLKYTQTCLTEALRLYPPVPEGLRRRTPPGGVTICGKAVPGDVTVGVHHMATYRSSAHFRNPDRFAPERWLGDPEYADDHRDAFEPFQTGPRNCLGQSLAWHEMRLLLVTVIRRFDLSLEPESQRWLNQKTYILWEKIPLMCRLRLVET